MALQQPPSLQTLRARFVVWKVRYLAEVVGEEKKEAGALNLKVFGLAS
jgi:hypothetical protein